MDYYSVITLGQLLNVPLIGHSSELADGLEPHDHIPTAVHAACSRRVMTVVQGGGVPGVAVGGYLGGVYRVPSQGSRLRLIYGI